MNIENHINQEQQINEEKPADQFGDALLTMIRTFREASKEFDEFTPDQKRTIALGQAKQTEMLAKIAARTIQNTGEAGDVLKYVNECLDLPEGEFIISKDSFLQLIIKELAKK